MQLNLTYILFCIVSWQLRNGKQREGRTPAPFQLQPKARLMELSNHLLMDCSSGKSLWKSINKQVSQKTSGFAQKCSSLNEWVRMAQVCDTSA